MKNQNIIKKNYEYQKIIDSKRCIKNKSFVIYFRKNNLKTFRYGVSVGKKIGNAVLRNKAKRQIRAMIYELLDSQKEKSFDVILIARLTILKKTYRENFEELKESFSSLK